MPISKQKHTALKRYFSECLFFPIFTHFYVRVYITSPHYVLNCILLFLCFDASGGVNYFAQRADKYSAGVRENSVQCYFNKKLKAGTPVSSEFSLKMQLFSYKISDKVLFLINMCIH